MRIGPGGSCLLSPSSHPTHEGLVGAGGSGSSFSEAVTGPGGAQACFSGTQMATSPSSSLATPLTQVGRPQPPFGANSSPPGGVRAGVAGRGCWVQASVGSLLEEQLPSSLPTLCLSKHCALYPLVLSPWSGSGADGEREDSTQGAPFWRPSGGEGRGKQRREQACHLVPPAPQPCLGQASLPQAWC